MAFPGVITHYHLADRAPFLNLSELDDAGLVSVLDELEVLHRDGRQHRPFGPKYMAIRRSTEARLRALFVAAGGRPERDVPHYFVLGKSRWYENLAVDMSSITLPLSALPPDQTSFTIPDSFTAMWLSSATRVTEVPKPYLGRVFRLHELDDAVERYGVPTPQWASAHEDWRSWPEEAYIEVQLWTDDPIRDHLR